jgi:hypothetical protein
VYSRASSNQQENAFMKRGEHEPAALSILTTPWPWPNAYDGTPAQVFATAEHVCAIHGWVPQERVMLLVIKLIDLAREANTEIDGSRGGNETETSRAALLAVRLILAYDLVLTDSDTLQRHRGSAS